MHDDDRFRIEIRGLAEFTAFVAIIRGEQVDAAKLKDLTAILNRSATDLQKASEDVPPRP